MEIGCRSIHGEVREASSIVVQPSTQLRLVYLASELHRCLHRQLFRRGMAVLIVTMQVFLKRSIPVILEAARRSGGY